MLRGINATPQHKALMHPVQFNLPQWFTHHHSMYYVREICPIAASHRLLHSPLIFQTLVPHSFHSCSQCSVTLDELCKQSDSKKLCSGETLFILFRVTKLQL